MTEIEKLQHAADELSQMAKRQMAAIIDLTRQRDRAHDLGVCSTGDGTCCACQGQGVLKCYHANGAYLGHKSCGFCAGIGIRSDSTEP